MGTNSTQNEVKNGFSLSKYLGNRGGCESCHPDQSPLIWAFFYLFFRDVAQPGSAHAWGAWGRRFKSCHPDLKTV